MVCSQNEFVLVVELKKLFWEELLAALSELPEPQRKIFVLNPTFDRH